MDFSLSSSLVGSAVLNPDRLSLDLQFAADKTLTARKGPTPVFTRASTAAFVGSNGLIQSAAVNTPRFDHDPVTLACKGLLIEESRTNACFNSNLLTSASWIPTNLAVAADAAGPDGATAYEVSETTNTANHNIGNSGSATSTLATSVVSGTNYTGSMFFKKVVGSVDWVQLTLGSGGFGTVQYANFNIGNGTIGNFAGLASGTSPQIQDYGNGWYRCSITVTASGSSTTSANIVAFLINNTNIVARGSIYAGNTANKIITAMGQFETGSFPTSYIPTTTASVIRSADVCSISGSDFSGFYNATEGSIISEGLIASLAGSNRGMLGISNNTASHGFATFYNLSSGGVVSQSRNTASTALLPTFANSANASFKRGLTYYSGGASISTNGATATDTVVTNSTQTMLTLQIGSMLAGAFYWSGHIASIRYYKKRLANAKLQALTASVIVLSGIGIGLGSSLGSGSSIVASEGPAFSTYDIDAQNYITAVEAADGQSLETATRLAINTFIEGCKSDGVWSAIKASCILAGARTLSGALVPLVGIAPTNANFVSSDYDRKTGLIGNGSTKFINSNRNNNADPRNNYHASVYLTSIGLDGRAYIGAGGGNTTGTTHLLSSAGSFVSKNRFPTNLIGGLSSLGFLGHSRSAGDAMKLRHNLTEYLANHPSSEPYPYNAFVFARNVNDLPQAPASGRISFYSIGEDLNLALLDARISNLMTTFASSIS